MAVSQKENVETFKNFVNGKWAPSRDGATFEDENPALRGSNIASCSRPRRPKTFAKLSTPPTMPIVRGSAHRWPNARTTLPSF